MITSKFSNRIRDVLVMSALAVGLCSAALGQSTAEIIRPVGQVCLADQPCVGQPIDSVSGMASADTQSSNSSASAATTTTAAPEPEPMPTSTTSAVAQSGNTAPAAATASAAASDFDAEAAYNRSCMACHMTGAAGAPRLGDAEAWEPRVAKGMDALMQSVMNGLGAMPARGLCMDCTDEQLRAIVDYMVSQ